MERLKRLAAEKKAAAATAVETSVATPVSQPQTIASMISGEVKDGNAADESVSSSGPDGSSDVLEGAVGSGSNGAALGTVLDSTKGGNVSSGKSSSNVPDVLDGSGCNPDNLPAELKSPTPSNHPLAMQFAELESLLTVDDSQFKVLLRDIHRHLGMEPDLVTMMTEDEVALVVKGMVHLANAEIIEPGKAKQAKASVAAAKKKVITEDDL